MVGRLWFSGVFVGFVTTRSTCACRTHNVMHIRYNGVRDTEPSHAMDVCNLLPCREGLLLALFWASVVFLQCGTRGVYSYAEACQRECHGDWVAATLYTALPEQPTLSDNNPPHQSDPQVEPQANTHTHTHTPLPRPEDKGLLLLRTPKKVEWQWEMPFLADLLRWLREL